MMLGSAMSHAGIHALLSAAGGPFVEEKDFTRWIDHPDAYEQARLGVAAVLNACRPEGGVSELKGSIGVQVANEILSVVGRKPRGKGTKEEWQAAPIYAWDPDTVRTLLGPPIVKRMSDTQKHKDLDEPTCCEWCDQPLSPHEAEAMRRRIGSAMRKGVVILSANSDDRTCLLCQKLIPESKLPEIKERIGKQAAEAIERFKEQGVWPDADFFNLAEEKAKRRKEPGS
jgi:hypothetical protein